MGGQAGITQTLDNFPGFDKGIRGGDFAERLGRQAKKFGVEILQAQDVQEIDRDGQYLIAEIGSEIHYHSKALLLATGAHYRRLDVPGEAELIGINVHFCATCDGAFYKGKKVLVVGGGNSGFEEGLFLTKFASQVDILVNSPQPKASRILQDKVAEMKNMRVILNHAVRELKGGNKLQGVILEDLGTHEKKEVKYDGVFVFIGVTPNNELIKDKAELDEAGFICRAHDDEQLHRSVCGGRCQSRLHQAGCIGSRRGCVGGAGDPRVPQVAGRVDRQIIICPRGNRPQLHDRPV